MYRNALIIGSNTGAPERQQLRYAVTDAYSFANVLKSIGGISNTSCIIVENPSVARVKQALQALKESAGEIKHKNARKEILFYYSGHADEHGFLLGSEVFEYSTLKAELNSISADVRIAIVDACASGSLTREKGGVKRPPFLYDASSKMEGHAYLTSSSDDESAIESDKIKGSYFTHSLVSGLRGAADFNSDGKVTLNEAYQFTFNETLRRRKKQLQVRSMQVTIYG
ncbi:MAG: caspase family protein [Fibrobacter sp.]|nr:caspase family protein [Fibrobacter sp.]